MPNSLSKFMGSVKQDLELPVPPEFIPIAHILQLERYRGDLTGKLRNPPDDFLDSEEWWADIANIVKAEPQEVKKVMGSLDSYYAEKGNKVLRYFRQMLRLPLVERDPELKDMIQDFVRRSRNGQLSGSEIKMMQNHMARKLQKAGLNVPKRPGEVSPGVQESSGFFESLLLLECEEDRREVLLEGSFGNALSRMVNFIRNPELSLFLNKDLKGNSVHLAKTLLYSLMRIVSDRYYQLIQDKTGLTRSQIIKAYRSRTKPLGQETLGKAAEAVNPKSQSNRSVVSQMYRKAKRIYAKATKTGADPVKAAIKYLKQEYSDDPRAAVVIQMLSR